MMIDEKCLSLRNTTREESKNLVVAHGNFNVLHPGHIRFLKFAKEQGSRLIVGLYSKETSEGAFLEDSDRLEALQALAFIDHVVVLDWGSLELIKQLSPEVVAKGKEHEKLINEEKLLVESYGGRLAFGSGEIVSSSNEFKKDIAFNNIQASYQSLSFMKRHQISKQKMLDTVAGFKDLKVAVFGDIIIDEYVTCTPLGISKEDPTIVVSPKQVRTFLGGAGIVAAHARKIGADVDFYSVTGEDKNGQFALSQTKEYGVEPFFVKDPSRPTTTKKRYRATEKTLLRVNDFRQHDISAQIRESIFSAFQAQADKYDLVIFSDFNYGLLCNGFLQNIMSLCHAKNIVMSADSQSSSQLGDLSKFMGMALISPTEYEARLTTQNPKDGLIKLSEQLGEQLNSKHVFVTLAEDGVLIRGRNRDKGWWDTDELPAMNNAPADVSGAGDAMLTVASMTLASNGTIWEAAFLSSIASACQVSRVGNIPITCEEIQTVLNMVAE